MCQRLLFGGQFLSSFFAEAKVKRRKGENKVFGQQIQSSREACFWKIRVCEGTYVVLNAPVENI